MTSPPSAMPTAELKPLYAALSTAVDKGKALEEFCAKFFDAIPGVHVVERNLLDDAHSQELDLVLENDQDLDGLDMLAPLIFVEAKNWASPVGSAEVAWLDWKVRLAGETDAVLVVANGVTGRSDDETSAWNILRWAKREKRLLLVMSPEEMVACNDTDDVRELIKAKKRRIATGKAPL